MPRDCTEGEVIRGCDEQSGWLEPDPIHQVFLTAMLVKNKRTPKQVQQALSALQSEAKRIVATKGRMSITRGGQPIRAGMRKRSSSGPTLASYAKQRMKPMTMATTRRRDGAACRIHGTDFFRAVSSGAANVAGDVLISAVVNPAQLGVSRLATLATLYERYKFKSLKFRYDPIAPATTAGQLIGYVDYDTLDDPTGLAGVQNLQRAAAHYGEKPVQVWQGSERPVFWEIKDVDPLTDLYVDSDGTDPRWTNQGRFVLLAASTLPATTALGNIYMDYDIEFYIPQIELTPYTGAGWKETFGGVGSQANWLGNASTVSTWSNLQITRALNVYTMPAGAWSVTVYAVGTVLAQTISSPDATSVLASSVTAADAKTQMIHVQVYASSPFTITLGGTATTVTGGYFMANLLPRDATTLSLKRIDRLNRLLELSGGIDELKKSLLARRECETESKVELRGPKLVHRTSHAGDSDCEVITQTPSGVCRIDTTSDYMMVRKK